MSLQTMTDAALAEAMEGTMFEFNYAMEHALAVEKQYISLWKEHRRREYGVVAQVDRVLACEAIDSSSSLDNPTVKGVV